jgi:hypothetical protein
MTSPPAVPGAAHALELSERYRNAAAGPTLERDALDPILEELGVVQSMTWWDRVRTWLEEVLGSRSESPTPDWLRDAVLPWDWILLGVLVALLLLSIGIIANEVRLRQRGRGRALHARRAVPGASEALSLDGVLTLPEHEQPGALLRLILGRVALADASNRFSVTHREIARAASALPTRCVEPVRRIASTAERIRYAGSPPEPEAVARAVSDGREVLEVLEVLDG